MLASIEPVLSLLHWAAVEAYVWWRTFGLDPMHTDHARMALLRAKARGGVNL